MRERADCSTTGGAHAETDGNRDGGCIRGAGRAMETMSRSKDEHERQNALRRAKAAELIASQLKKRQRERTDAELLSSEQARKTPAKPARPKK